jgi:acyl-CoA synthetase (AMP-forming)/AMP-acid ligase II
VNNFSWLTLHRSYGLTENAAICTLAVPGDASSSGTVGPPQPAVEIKLVDVPMMGYTSQDKPGPRGELCTRGPVNFLEYYKGEKLDFVSVDEIHSNGDMQTLIRQRRQSMTRGGYTRATLENSMAAAASRLLTGSRCVYSYTS